MITKWEFYITLEIIPIEQVHRPIFLQLLHEVLLFTNEERAVALELAETAWAQQRQQLPQDYLLYATLEVDGTFSSFICFGPTPMAQGTYDLYWIGTANRHEKKGRAKALVVFMREKLRELQGRLVRIETSSKDTYQGTLAFYHCMQFEEVAVIRDFYSVGDHLVIFTDKVE